MILPNDGDLDLADGDTELDGADSDLPLVDGDGTDLDPTENEAPDGDGLPLPDGDGTEAADESGGDSDTNDTADRETDSDFDVERVEMEFDLPVECSAGELSCSGSWVIRCASSGHWSIETDCTQTSGIEPGTTGYCEAGLCKTTPGSGTCFEGAARCKDSSHSEVCTRASGASSLAWAAKATCSTTQYCVAGYCLEKACTPGSKRCMVSLSELCADDGTSWTPFQQCDLATQTCLNGECITTTNPDSCNGSSKPFRCLSDTQTQYCNPANNTWTNFETCTAGKVCSNGNCLPTCDAAGNCPSGYRCLTTEKICTLAPTKCLRNTDCPGVGGKCIFTAGESVGTCEQNSTDSCAKDSDCTGCTYCDTTTLRCAPYTGEGSCKTSADCSTPSEYMCVTYRDTCTSGFCVPTCLSGLGVNCKAMNQVCDESLSSRTYGTCIDRDVCVPCADDNDCGDVGRCGWREDSKVKSGCCEWRQWSRPVLCHEACPDTETCFPNADTCGQTSCPNGQCVLPDGTCGLCNCTNTSPYCIYVPNDPQGTCCPGYYCTSDNLCAPRSCDFGACMHSDGSCGVCQACSNPTGCGLGQPPCCTGYSCEIAAGASTGTCVAVGCYGKSCTPFLNDCCLENSTCYVAKDTDTAGYCL